MSWLYEHHQYESEKNGYIDCYRRFGVWEVIVGGFGETAPYLQKLWLQSFDHLPKKARIEKILVVGFGGGGNVVQLNNRFPGCKITAIEWDPVMVEIADRIKLFPTHLKPRIIIDDAFHASNELKETFDLILFDAYFGNCVMDKMRDSEFSIRLQKLLKPDGYFLYNASAEPEVIPVISQHFRLLDDWQYFYNRVALFCQLSNEQNKDK